MIVEIYSRPGCHLCDEAKALLRSAAERFHFTLVERNVEENPEWESAYGHQVPVVFIDGRKAFKYRIRSAELEKLLARERESRQFLEHDK